MQRQLASGLFFTMGGVILAYIFATLWVDQNLYGTIGYDYLIMNAFDLRTQDEGLFTQVWLIFLFLAIGGFAFGAHSASEALTKQGTSEWQSRWEMRRNKLLGKPGKGFILAKTSVPESRGQFITSDKYPNCLIVAPTGAGKGVGFVYPNLFTFEGSTVTLDVKGENFKNTARWRAHMGNKIYKFAPVEFGKPSHRYNPLERIGTLTDYGQINFELRKIATLFLQADGAGEWLKGAIQLFSVMGGVAYERKDFTLGGIHRALSEGEGDLQKHIKNLSQTAKEPALRTELAGMAKLETKTLSSYKSVLNNAGFDLWANPHIDDMTSASDFTFNDLRREKTSIYFVVAEADLEPLAGLVRLFFNELVATIQSRMPEKDEPYHAMIILDEFHLLGKMTAVARAMTTIRGFHGRIAIITQTIPVLDSIYSYEERLSIQGGAGLKLYMTPSEEMTIEDLSKACGMTSKRAITRSRQVGLGQRVTLTERTDERPLLTEDGARRLPEDVSIIIVNGKQPLKVKAIVHHRDRHFAKILEMQNELSWEAVEKSLLQSRINHLERKSLKAQQPPPPVKDAPANKAEQPSEQDGQKPATSPGSAENADQPATQGAQSPVIPTGKAEQAPQDEPQTLRLPSVRDLTTDDMQTVAAYVASSLDLYDEIRKLKDAEPVPAVVDRTRKKAKRDKLNLGQQFQLEIGSDITDGPVESGDVEKIDEDKKKPPEAT